MDNLKVIYAEMQTGYMHGYVRTYVHITYILWRIDPLLSSDSVKSGRC
jgi:hypothetical protein